ncbi:MAG TPA: hypothetical protein PKD53_10555 [Chloroflexaceae bacterium]|nr:hypothetical protein [Chloroflexaceae bacterium]
MSQRVLLVEASAGEASVHQVRLASAGYTVKLVTTAATTAGAARAFGPDLVVLDVDLLERSGMDVAALLRAAPATPHLLLVPSDGAVGAGAVQAEAPVAYLARPFSAAALVEGVNQLRPGA